MSTLADDSPDAQAAPQDPASNALQDRWTVLSHDPGRKSAKGMCPESWLCVDCSVNTAPGFPNRKEVDLALALHGETSCQYTAETEVYTVTKEVWQATGLEDMGGCLCIGCLEKRIGRRLKPDDFLPDHALKEADHARAALKRAGSKPGEIRGCDLCR